MRRTSVHGVDLASYEVGASPGGDVVVVVPGLCVSSYLRSACDALADVGFNVSMVEPPGWPRSGRPTPESRTIAELAAWVAGWLEARNMRDVVLIGQSTGSQIAAHVAALAPDRIRSLVLQGPVFDPSFRTPGRATVRFLLDMPREKPGLVVRAAPEWLRVGPRGVWRTLRMALADRLEDTVTTVRPPVLVLLGEHETLATREWAQGLATTPADFQVLADQPHSSPHRDPTGFAALVRSRCPAGCP